MAALFIALAFLSSLAAVIFATSAIQQTTYLVGGCFCLILAAIIQSGDHHKELLQVLTTIAERSAPPRPAPSITAAPALNTKEAYCPICGKTSEPKGSRCGQCGAFLST